MAKTSSLKSWQNVKIKKTALRELRLIYALTGQTMVSIMGRLISAELARVQKEQAGENKIKDV